MKEKINVIDAEYDEKRDLVQLLIVRQTGEKRVFCFPGQDIASFIGVTQTLSVNDIVFFCDKIKGKTMLWESRLDDRSSVMPEDIATINRLSREISELQKESISKDDDQKRDLVEIEKELEVKYKIYDDIIAKYGSVFDNYPYYEVLDILKENGAFIDLLEADKTKYTRKYPPIHKLPENTKDD